MAFVLDGLTGLRTFPFVFSLPCLSLEDNRGMYFYAEGLTGHQATLKGGHDRYVSAMSYFSAV